MSEQLSWARWWAFPWSYAHEDWKDHQYALIDALYQRTRLMSNHLTGMGACLPPAPPPTVLRLALASNEQLDLALTLVHDTFNPNAAHPLSDSHHLWCTRLSKALPLATLSHDADPLQLLHSWLEPAVWQRLRLRFSRERVHEVETKRVCLEDTSNRFNTLWHAVVWRATSLPIEPIVSDSTDRESNDVMSICH